MRMITKLLIACTGVFLLSGCAQDSEPQPSATLSPEVYRALLANGDAEAGKRIYIYCQSCHSINEGGPNKVGPNLYGIYGSQAARNEDFIFSAALIEANVTWTEDALDQWILRPTALVPGSTMVFAGVNNPQQRADLIAFLREAGPAR